MSTSDDFLADCFVYFDRDGKEIDEDRWHQLKAIPTYCTVREFDNGQFIAKVLWEGVKRSRYLVEYGPPPIVHGDRFTRDATVAECDTEDEAVNLYEHVLAENTDCEFMPSDRTASGVRLMEVGNRATGMKSVQETDAEVTRALSTSPNFGTW